MAIKQYLDLEGLKQYHGKVEVLMDEKQRKLLETETFVLYGGSAEQEEAEAND